jgi:hypothetical protein
MLSRVTAALALVAACGTPSGVTPQADGAVIGDAPAFDAAIEPGWTALIQRSWQLGSGSDSYKCRRILIPEDLWVTGFRAMSPIGTHHELLTISASATPLGDYDCDASNLDPRMLFAGGVNTDDLVFPPGVAIKLAAGQYIHLNLHLYNASDQPLTGTSGILIKTVEASEVVHEADMVFAGAESLAIPSTNTPHTETGGCTAPATWNVFNLWPHMHAAGRRSQLVVHRGTQTMALHDESYSFVEQRNSAIPVFQIQQNDEIEVTCTYVNNSGQAIGHGELAHQEMCLTGMYKWPAGGNPFGCVSN